MTYSHQKGYAEKTRQEKSFKLPPINQRFDQNGEKRVVNLGYQSEVTLRTPKLDSNGTDRREETSLSQESSRSKKIYKWHVWWDKPRSDVRVPSFPLPSKKVPSKIGSLEKIKHKPGGGNVVLLNDKLNWKRVARIDHLAKGYAPGGGNRRILNEKLNWRTSSKIGSLENMHHIPGGGNIAIVDQPFNRHGIRPRIDSGFIYEEAYVPIDYAVKTTPRTPNLEAIHETFTKPRSIKN